MNEDERIALLQYFLYHGTRLYQEFEDASLNYSVQPNKIRKIQRDIAAERLHEFERVKLAVLQLLHMDSDNPD